MSAIHLSFIEYEDALTMSLNRKSRDIISVRVGQHDFGLTGISRDSGAHGKAGSGSALIVDQIESVGAHNI